MKALLVSGSMAGMLLIFGEGVLNSMILANEWRTMNDQLGLPAPGYTAVSMMLLKLFLLGFIIMWLYELVAGKYGFNNKSAFIAGGFMALLVWGWVLWGLLLAGYINFSIALPTLMWGMIELPLITILSGKVYNKLSKQDI